MLVWYWAGEHLWTTQDYTGGLRYAEKALPLTYRLGDPSLQSYCERLVGLFYFRQSDYQKANRTEVKTHLNVIRFRHIPVLRYCLIWVNVKSGATYQRIAKTTFIKFSTPFWQELKRNIK